MSDELFHHPETTGGDDMDEHYGTVFLFVGLSTLGSWRSAVSAEAGTGEKMEDLASNY